MSQFFNSISDVAKNYKGYDNWEQQQDNIAAQKQYLIKQKPLDKFEKEALEKKAKTIVRVSEIMDTRSEDNAQDVELLTQAAAGVGTAGLMMLSQFGLMKYFEKKLRSTIDKRAENILMKKYFGTQIGMLFASLLVTAGFILWGTSKTKEASRLGRYQAKKHELKDAKSFVQFTPEQIAKAEKIAEAMPDEKDKTGLLRAIKNVKQMLADGKDYKAYKEGKKHSKQPDNVPQKLTKAQREQAEQDKELLLNVIKKINNTAEDYSENVENAFDTITATSFLATIPLGFGLNKLFTKLKLNIPKAKVAGGISMVFPLIVGLMSLNAEKKAARVGRYVAKKEIVENPELLRKFSDEDMKSAAHISAPKRNNGFFHKIGENFKFIGKYFKDSRGYDKYIKKERPKHEKLNKALLQVEVTDKQLKEAKHLQDKTFMSFDKIDEMSQRYSEDMEAAGEIGKNVVSTGFSLAGVGALGGLAYLFCRGKLPTHKIIKFLSKITFKKSSPIRQTTDELYKVINGKKELKQAFNKLLSPMSDKKSITTLLFSNDISEVIRKKCPAVATSVMEGIMNPELLLSKLQNIKLSNVTSHLQDNAIAKWARSLLTEISVLTAKGKIPYEYQKEAAKVGDSIISNLTGRKITNNYSRYKTLINTSAVAGIPVLGVIVGIPFAICSWLTNMQKKAGRIGVMKAIKDLDNPNLFVNADELPAKADNSIADKDTIGNTDSKKKEIFNKFLSNQPA